MIVIETLHHLLSYEYLCLHVSQSLTVSEEGREGERDGILCNVLHYVVPL